MSEKVYVPKSSAKEVSGQYGKFIKLSFKADDLRAFLDQHTNEKGYLNLTISQRKEDGKFGDTHSVCLDTWKPTGRQADAPSAELEPPEQTNFDDVPDDVPF